MDNLTHCARQVPFAKPGNRTVASGGVSGPKGVGGARANICMEQVTKNALSSAPEELQFSAELAIGQSDVLLWQPWLRLQSARYFS